MSEVSAGHGSAEIEKLAHQLGVPPERLDFLTPLPADDLRELRIQIGDTLFEAGRHHFTRMASLSNSVPTAVTAKITQAALPAMIAARTAELLEPRKAAELVGRLPDDYLIKVSSAMDPSRAPEVIAAMPADKVAAIGAELARREQWVVIGGFVSYVSDEGLAQSLAGYDGEALVRISYVLDDTARLGQIIATLSDDQIADMITAASEQALWRELDGLLCALTADEAQRLAGAFAAADEAQRAAFDAAAERGELGADARGKLAAA